jgi:hypothetical protein
MSVAVPLTLERRSYLEYVVKADGTPVLFRSVPNRHIMGFTTDGTTLFWTEGFGGSSATAPPTEYEVWSAPYTSNPSVLAATARKLSSVDGGPGFVGGVSAAGGIYVVVTGACAEITRQVDGEVREICAGPQSAFGGWLFLSTQELWTIVGASGGANYNTVRRLPMPSW